MVLGGFYVLSWRACRAVIGAKHAWVGALGIAVNTCAVILAAACLYRLIDLMISNEDPFARWPVGAIFTWFEVCAILGFTVTHISLLLNSAPAGQRARRLKAAT